MHEIFYESDQDPRPVNCRHCNWHGHSDELIKGDFLEMIEITELFCPSCERYLGFVQHNCAAQKATQL